MHGKRLIPALALALAALLSGCSSVIGQESETAKPAFNNNAEYNYALGLQYQAEGRHELARERFLQALAISRDEEFRSLMAQEIEAADKALRSMR